jgi:hypothetical protein
VARGCLALGEPTTCAAPPNNRLGRQSLQPRAAVSLAGRPAVSLAWSYACMLGIRIHQSAFTSGPAVMAEGQVSTYSMQLPAGCSAAYDNDKEKAACAQVEGRGGRVYGG